MKESHHYHRLLPTPRSPRLLQSRPVSSALPNIKEWRAYCQDFPGAEMVTKTIKKAKNKKNDAKNRTYKKMAEYIDCQENADALKKEFEAQKKLSIVQKSPYRFVLNWFLATFPELKENEDKESEAVAPAADQIEAAEPQELPIAS